MNQITVIERPKIKEKDLLALIERQTDPIILMRETTYYAIARESDAIHEFSFVIKEEEERFLELNSKGYAINNQYPIYFKNDLPFGVVEVR